MLPEVISGAAPIASLQFAPARSKRPRGASFVVLSSAVCKVGRRIRQRGFHVGWHDLTLDPENLRRLRSDARSGRVLPGQAAACPKPVERPQMLRDNSLSRKTSKRETSGRVIAIIRELQEFAIPRILIHPLSSHISRTAPVTSLEQHHRTHSIIIDQCASGAPWMPRTRLIAGHCDHQDILALAENTCEEHHVCAFSAEACSTIQTSPTPPLLQARQHYHPLRNWTQITPAPSSTKEHPTSSALWDDLVLCGHILSFSNLSWLALYPRPSRQLHQT